MSAPWTIGVCAVGHVEHGSTLPIALNGAAVHWDRSHTRHGDTP